MPVTNEIASGLPALPISVITRHAARNTAGRFGFTMSAMSAPVVMMMPLQKPSVTPNATTTARKTCTASGLLCVSASTRCPTPYDNSVRTPTADRPKRSISMPPT